MLFDHAGQFARPTTILYVADPGQGQNNMQVREHDGVQTRGGGLSKKVFVFAQLNGKGLDRRSGFLKDELPVDLSPGQEHGVDNIGFGHVVEEFAEVIVVVAKVMLACRSLEMGSLEPQGIKLRVFSMSRKYLAYMCAEGIYQRWL